MAKRKRGVTKRKSVDKDNKSEAIRIYKLEHPSAKPKEIAAALNRQGFKVTPQYISTILSNDRRRNGVVRKRGRPSGSSPSSEITVENLKLVKQLVDRTGGIQGARRAIDSYAELIS